MKLLCIASKAVSPCLLIMEVPTFFLPRSRGSRQSVALFTQLSSRFSELLLLPTFPGQKDPVPPPPVIVAELLLHGEGWDKGGH